MENQNINVNVEEETIVEETKTNEDVKEVKTFTQEEVNAILEKRLSREIKKIEAEKQKAMELELKAELEEAEKLAKMSETERVKAKAERERAKFEKERKKFEEEMRAFNQERMLNTTMTTLSEKNLPVEFASFLRADNAEQIMDNISTFEKHFNDAVEKAVLERLRGKTPQTGTATKNFDMNELRNMSVAENTANLQFFTIPKVSVCPLSVNLEYAQASPRKNLQPCQVCVKFNGFVAWQTLVMLERIICIICCKPRYAKACTNISKPFSIEIIFNI